MDVTAKQLPHLPSKVNRAHLASFKSLQGGVRFQGTLHPLGLWFTDLIWGLLVHHIVNCVKKCTRIDLTTIHKALTFFGSIQEDQNKVEQFHFLWNSCTICGTVPQFVKQRLKNVKQLPKKWNRCWKRVAVQQIVEQFHNLWNRFSYN